MRIGKNGGPAELILPDDVQTFTSSPPGLVAMRANADPAEGGGKFQLLPWSGGPPTDACDYEALDFFGANDTTVAWIHFREIEACPLTGGPPRQVLALAPPELAQSFAIDSTHAFWSASGLIHRVPLAGGERETVAADADPPAPAYGLVLDGDEIFYRQGSRVVSIPKTGGTPREAVPPQTGPIAFFTVTATHVYWGEGREIICLKRKLK